MSQDKKSSKNSSVELSKIDEAQLSLDLIEAQYALKESRDGNCAKSVLILVSGIELAGKGEAVKQLREWLDPRYLIVNASRPFSMQQGQTFWQPYLKSIPAQGQIVVLFGNWYGDLLVDILQQDKPDLLDFEQQIKRMRSFEHYLAHNHVDVVKVWFDLDWKTLQQRLDDLDPSEENWHKLHGLDWRNEKKYEQLQTLRRYFTEDWYEIDGAKQSQRDQQFAVHLLKHLQDLPEHCTTVKKTWLSHAVDPRLIDFVTEDVAEEDYKKKYKKLSKAVAEALRREKRNVVIAFEGMDAAGKGGAIKRIVKYLDPREYEIHTIAAPEKYELRRPYLWRFWTKLPTHAGICIFDRTWYGRVLVERIEGFASEPEWQRAYGEINRFEHQLVENGTVLIKFWLAISLDEQAQRFKAREETPHKRFKITEEDWRNREKWDQYLVAASDMLHLTHTETAPWYVVATDNKYQARIQVLEAILAELQPKS